MNIKLSDYFFAEPATAEAFIQSYFSKKNKGKLTPVRKAFESLQFLADDRSFVAMERFYHAIELKKSKSSEKAIKLLTDRVKAVGSPTAFIICCDKGYFNVAKIMHSSGVTLQLATVGENFSPLHFSVDRDNLEMTHWLISQKVDLNAQTTTKEWTPLHYACHKKLKRQVIPLLVAGADPNAKTKGGNTPMHIACHVNNLRIAYMLMKFGADPSLENDKNEKPKNLFAGLLTEYTTPLFPKDVWKKIIQYISDDELFRAREVSKLWRQFITGILSDEFARKSSKNAINPY